MQMQMQMQMQMIQLLFLTPVFVQPAQPVDVESFIQHMHRMARVTELARPVTLSRVDWLLLAAYPVRIFVFNTQHIFQGYHISHPLPSHAQPVT